MADKHHLVDDCQLLMDLYRQIYKLTREYCDTECKTARNPSCCHAAVCEAMMAHAWDNWGIPLFKTNHPSLPLMGPNGCIAPPHLRPLCTLHVCCINAFGEWPGYPEWSGKYWMLRLELKKVEDRVFPPTRQLRRP